MQQVDIPLSESYIESIITENKCSLICCRLGFIQLISFNYWNSIFYFRGHAIDIEELLHNILCDIRATSKTCYSCQF